MSIETLGDGSGAMPARPLLGANVPLRSPSPDPPAPAVAFGIDHAELPPVPVTSGSSPQPIARNNPVAIPLEPLATLPPGPPAVALNTPAPAESLVPASTAEPRPAEHPGQRQPPADPAPLTDVESDPFSKMGSATFHAGKLEARSGRRVKTVRPRLSLAAQYDLLALTDPNVILKVKIDSTGKVISVDILRSSGSSDVDLCCQQAMYQWWIQPLKNAAGQPQPDVMVWHLYWK
jgi:TonB family protein